MIIVTCTLEILGRTPLEKQLDPSYRAASRGRSLRALCEIQTCTMTKKGPLPKFSRSAHVLFFSAGTGITD